jgi:hypothetical protein
LLVTLRFNPPLPLAPRLPHHPTSLNIDVVQAKEKAVAAEAELTQVRKQVEVLQADKSKLEGEVGDLKEEKQKATDNWKNWAKKAEERKTKSQAVEKERDDLKQVSPPPPASVFASSNILAHLGDDCLTASIVSVHLLSQRCHTATLLTLHAYYAVFSRKWPRSRLSLQKRETMQVLLLLPPPPPPPVQPRQHLLQKWLSCERRLQICSQNLQRFCP